MTASSSDAADRVLLLSPADETDASGGRAMLGRINLLLLRELLGERLVHLRPLRTTSRWADAPRGYIDGVDAALIADVIERIDRQAVTRLFVDGSNFGALVAAVKRARPAVRIVTFFHNVEARFFWGALRARRSPKALAVLAANYVAERKAVRRSDILVTLSERDSTSLKRLYGRAADAVAPMVLEERRSEVKAPPPLARRYVLFVGGAFYANIAGIDWFAREVAPHIGLHVAVVGRGMEVLADSLAANPAVTLVGGVDDLAPWYAGAALVVAPIFDGSGMKTKVAEALMHGKHVAGSPEAFSGYADDVVAANFCCTTVEQFTRAINRSETSPPPAFDETMRALYERDHSPSAAKVRLSAILSLCA